MGHLGAYFKNNYIPTQLLSEGMHEITISDNPEFEYDLGI